LVAENVNASYPPFKVFNNSQYSARLATDHKYALDLTKAVQLTKQDEQLFHDLAHSIQYDLDMDDTEYNDGYPHTVCDYWPWVTSIVAVVALA
jgi:hypothetical protein